MSVKSVEIIDVGGTTISRNGLELPGYFLLQYGCRDCYWYSYGYCPSGKKLDIGYCSSIIDYLFSLGDNLLEIKERYHVDVQSVRSTIDHREYCELKARYDSLVASGTSPSMLKDMEFRLTALRMWWERLSDTVTKHLGKINDRKGRMNQKMEHVHKLELSQLHEIANSVPKKLEDKKKDD